MVCDNLLNKLCFGVYEAGNGHGIGFHKVEPTFGEWAAHGSILGLLKTVSGLCELDQKRTCGLVLKLFEVNGLSCVGINRLMHKLDVLT